MTLRGEHVSTLESKTGPGAGQVDAICMGIDLAHTSISSLSGDPTGRQEPSQSWSHCQAEPTNRIRPDTAFRIMYIMFKVIRGWLARILPLPRNLLWHGA